MRVSFRAEYKHTELLETARRYNERALRSHRQFPLEKMKRVLD